MSSRYNYISSYPYGSGSSYPISNSRWSCTSSGVCVENNYSGEYTNLRSCINACSNNSCSTCYNPYQAGYYQPIQPYPYPYPIYTPPQYVYQPVPVYSYYPQSLLYYNHNYNHNYHHDNRPHHHK